MSDVPETVIHGCLQGHLFNALDHQGGETPYDTLDLFPGHTPTVIRADHSLTEAIKALDTAHGALFKSVSVVSIVSDDTERDVFNELVLGGTLAVGDVLKAEVLGRITKNTTGTLTLRVTLGTTEMYEGNLVLANSANERAFRLRLELLRSSASKQLLHGAPRVGSTDAPATGVGDLTTTNAVAGSFAGIEASEDLSSPQAWHVTLEWSASSADLDVEIESREIVHVRG